MAASLIPATTGGRMQLLAARGSAVTSGPRPNARTVGLLVPFAGTHSEAKSDGRMSTTRRPRLSTDS